MFRCIQTPDGLRMDMGPKEVDMLLFLGRELRRLLENGDSELGILKPFHPSQQRDHDPRAVHAELDGPMDADLMRFRLQRIESVQKELIPKDRSRGGIRVLLDETKADLWLAYLTDLRLLVGTVIGYSDENPMPYPQDDPEHWTREVHMYHFLSAVQEHLLDLVMGEE